MSVCCSVCSGVVCGVWRGGLLWGEGRSGPGGGVWLPAVGLSSLGIVCVG